MVMLGFLILKSLFRSIVPETRHTTVLDPDASTAARRLPSPESSQGAQSLMSDVLDHLPATVVELTQPSRFLNEVPVPVSIQPMTQRFVSLATMLLALSPVISLSNVAQTAPWFEHCLVGLEVGPTGSHFGSSTNDPGFVVHRSGHTIQIEAEAIHEVITIGY
jgi:hypothetical protein